jgi:uncharacterized protein
MANLPLASKRVLILAGGWEGHQPHVMAAKFAGLLRAEGAAVEIATSLAVLDDAARLKTFDLIFPGWTMGTLTADQSRHLREAIASGVHLGGIHGGMGDAFRGDIEYQWMVGGHFVGHPHVGDYVVRITDHQHPISAGLPTSFAYRSEQYYLLSDPGIHVLPDTAYTYEGQIVTMPVAWVKSWGRARVFYCALGHDPAEFSPFPLAQELVLRGLRWALTGQV